MNKAAKELATRSLARKDFKTFMLLKWQRYNKAEFLDNWHFDFLAKILSHTLKEYVDKKVDSALGNHSADLGICEEARTISPLTSPQIPKNTQSNTANPRIFINDSSENLNTQAEESDGTKILGFEMRKASFQGGGAGSYLSGNDQADTAESRFYRSKPNLITRLMLNMPPSYGKTETIARCFIAWALGRDRSRKFIYISYSDELCRKICNQVRDLIKSRFWQSIFIDKPEFLQDNSSEFVLKEGGGLFVTTLKSAITGFHAHQILIDDPIKVSAMNSKVERDNVNQNFKESVLSRLQDVYSNITILMQRLGDEDLCGYLLNPRYFEEDIINQWEIIKLPALNTEPITYMIDDFSYERAVNEPLFPKKHNLNDLNILRASMGEDEFATQYLQEPQASEAGYFLSEHFKTIQSYEIGIANEYIFVDNAMSLNTNADNRAILTIALESKNDLECYIIKDCLYGIWSEEETISHIIEAMSLSPKAEVFIESDGGGLTLHRLLQKEIIRVNQQLKTQHKDIIYNNVKTYTASRKISKVEKIKALRAYYNTGYLLFSANARGLDQIKRELFAFNPQKPYRKDDCIDAIASCVANESVRAPQKQEIKPAQSGRYAKKTTLTWRI